MTESKTPVKFGLGDTQDQPGNPETLRSPDGRYIPYSGGCLGWFENSGVMKSELRNNYQLTTALSAEVVRQKQFERWGEIGNRRNEERAKAGAEAAVTVSFGTQAWRATVADVSPHGMRLRSLDALTVKVHDRVRLLVDNDGKRLDFEAEVMWLQEAGKLRPVWNLGLSFPGMSKEQSEQLQERVTRK